MIKLKSSQLAGAAGFLVGLAAATAATVAFALSCSDAQSERLDIAFESLEGDGAADVDLEPLTGATATVTGTWAESEHVELEVWYDTDDNSSIYEEYQAEEPQ